MATSPIDLCTVAQVQAILDPEGSVTTWKAAQIAEQQALITEGSANFLNWTGRRTLNRVLTFSDLYDGTGSDRQWVRDYPIHKVFEVIVDGIAIPQGSSGPNGITPGWVIDQGRDSLSIVGSSTRGRNFRGGAFSIAGTQFRSQGWSFGTKDNNNRQNVFIQYQGGPNITTESATITGGTYTVLNAAQFFDDLGVVASRTAQAFTLVSGTPGPLQYAVDSNTGIYSFNAADDGTGIQIEYGYNGAPLNLQLGVAEMVALNFKRTKTLDLKSVDIAEGGTNTYRDWIMSPKVQRMLDYYTRGSQGTGA